MSTCIFLTVWKVVFEKMGFPHHTYSKWTNWWDQQSIGYIIPAEEVCKDALSGSEGLLRGTFWYQMG